jgi:hypothetical protein
MYLFKSFVDQSVIVSFGTDALATGYKSGHHFAAIPGSQSQSPTVPA